MTTRTARCHCGDLMLACAGEPAKISMCHCLDCQRRTGSLFSIAVFYPRERIAIGAAPSRSYERPSASGFPVRFHFCAACGANIYWEPARLPALIGVAAGAFADPTFPAPEQAVWTQDQHAWLDLPETIRCFAQNPPPRLPAS